MIEALLESAALLAVVSFCVLSVAANALRHRARLEDRQLGRTSNRSLSSANSLPAEDLLGTSDEDAVKAA